MGMLSDFLTLIKGTQTNINGVLTGVNGKLIGTDVDDGSDSLATKGYVDTSIADKAIIKSKYTGNATTLTVKHTGTFGLFIIVYSRNEVAYKPGICVVFQHSTAESPEFITLESSETKPTKVNSLAKTTADDGFIVTFNTGYISAFVLSFKNFTLS